MFSVLLCDDEISVTQFLRDSMPWETLGVEQIYTAADGCAALEVFSRNRVDLLITDIRMPGMDGLELLRHVRRLYPDVHCILLTAYGEFEYARDAYRLGIDNYLLKPIQISELTETIENTIENLYIRRKNEELLFRENILRRWLSGTISEEELAERSSVLGELNIYQSQYCAVCMSKVENRTSLSALSNKVIPQLNMALKTVDCLHVWDNYGRFVIIIGGRGIDRQIVRDIIAENIEYMHFTGKVTAVVGTCAHHCEGLSESYQRAAVALDVIAGRGNDGGLPHLTSLDASSPICTTSTVSLVEDACTADDANELELSEDNLSPIVRALLDYVRSNYAKGVSLKEFCTTHTITTAYLGYLFKKETGVFFNNYLNSLRLKRAIELLENSNEKINSIGQMSGFASPSYFISSFKKFTGVSPQKYRERCQR